MPQYWIQTPVENAKEVVQRWIDANSGTLIDYAGATVSYDEQCEVVLYNLQNTFVYDSSVIYFGNIIIPTDDNGAYYTLWDGTNPEINIFLGPINAGTYKGIIFNNAYDIVSTNSYFVGYKFNITTP